MKHTLIVLMLVAAPSCKAVDGMLGMGGEVDRSEETIQTGETVIRSVGDSVIPGVGGALAVLFGLGARSYVKRRKAAKAA